MKRYNRGRRQAKYSHLLENSESNVMFSFQVLSKHILPYRKVVHEIKLQIDKLNNYTYSEAFRLVYMQVCDWRQ